MSLIHKKHKYNNSFNAKDTILSFPSSQNKTHKSNSFQLSSSVTNSPRDFLPNKPLGDSTYDHYFGQLNLSKSPKYNVTNRNSSLDGAQMTSEISISDLYKFSESHKDSPTPFPSISIKKPKVPELKLSQLPINELEQTASLTSSGLKSISKNNSQTTRSLKPQGPRRPQLYAYLDYLTLNNNLNDDRLTQKLKTSTELRNPKTFSFQHCPVLEMNTHLIPSILPVITPKVSQSHRVHLVKEKSSFLNHRSSKIISEIPDSLILDSKTSSKADIAPPSKRSQIINSIRKVNPMFHSTQQKRKQSHNFAETSTLFKDIAMNLREVYLHHKNERQFSKIIEALAEENFEILKIVLSKYHKITDYDPVKLEQRFLMIEFIHENLPIPVRLQKKREGRTLLEISLFTQLQIFSSKLEDYNVRRRYENLESIHYGLQETRQKIRMFQEKKGNQLAKEGKVLEFLRNLDKTSNIEKNFTVERRGTDPSAFVEDLKRDNLNYKYLKKKNLDFALCVNSIYNEWTK